MRIVGLVVVSMFVLSMAACGGKATKEDCQKMFTHMFEIAQPKDMPEAAKTAAKEAFDKGMAEQVDACVKAGTPKSAVDCVMKAQTIEEATKCAGGK